MAPAPAPAVVATAAPVNGRVFDALDALDACGGGSAATLFPGGSVDDEDVSFIGIVLPPGITVSEVVGGIGLPALAASRMLRIAGPDQTSAAPTPIAAEPPRTKSLREKPAAAVSPASCAPASSRGVFTARAPSSSVRSRGDAQAESSTFDTESPFPS